MERLPKESNASRSGRNWDRVFTTAVHAGLDIDNPLHGLSTPINHSTTYRYNDPDLATNVHEGVEDGYFYGRMGGPTQRALECAMAELEGGEDAIALASGMAAISATLLAMARPGDHVVAPSAVYTSTATLLDSFLEPFGVLVTRVDQTNAENIARAVTPETKAIYVETPSNPTLRLTDLAAAGKIAADNDVPLVVDNTFATPVNQRPLDWGANVVVHSGTKYLGGHSDAMAGVVVGTADVVRQIRWHVNKVLGAVLSPFSAWLVLRGIRTLPVRMARHNENGLAVAQALQGARGVMAVHYPGLASHPQHDLMVRQMNGAGGIVAFDVGDSKVARGVIQRVRLCSPATSLGDVATLIQHSSTVTHASLTESQRQDVGVTGGLIRLSVGLERAVDIVDDLLVALEAVCVKPSPTLSEERPDV